MDFLYAIFSWILVSSIMGSVLIALILLVKRLFSNRLNGTAHYYIWFLLVIRLTIPYVPQSSISVFNIFPEMTNVQLSECTTQSNLISIGDYKIQKVNIIDGISNKEKKDTATNKTSLYDFLELSLISIWLTGAFIFLVKAITVNHYILLKIRKNHRKARGSKIESTFEQCKSMVKVSRNIPILFTKEVKTPCISGIIRPKILLPEHLISKISSEELKYILVHELAHYKRKDIIIRWISVIIKAFHWFNPLIWYAFYQMQQDCENACDAFVMSLLEPEEKTEYGYTIIHLLQLGSMQKMLNGTLGILMLTNKFQLKRRITMISNFKKASLKQVFATIMIFLFISITGLTGAHKVAAASKSVLLKSSARAKSVTLVKKSSSKAKTKKNKNYVIIGTKKKGGSGCVYITTKVKGYSKKYRVVKVKRDKSGAIAYSIIKPVRHKHK